MMKNDFLNKIIPARQSSSNNDNINNDLEISQTQLDISERSTNGNSSGGSMKQLQVGKPMLFPPQQRNGQHRRLSSIGAKADSPPGIVEIGYRVYSVTDINNASNTACVDLRIFLLYRDEAMINCGGFDGGQRPAECLAEEVEFGRLKGRKPYFPYVEIANATSTEEIDRGYRVLSDAGDVKSHFRVRAVVLQSLKFHCFPFDKHEITVKIRIPRKCDSSGVQFRISEVYGNGNNSGSNNGNSTRSLFSTSSRSDAKDKDSKDNNAVVEAYAHEWAFDAPVMEIVEEKNRGGSLSVKSTMKVIIPVTRHCHHYVYDILLVLAFMILAAGSVFFYEITDLEGRINLVVTCILTTVAFKFVCLEKIPPAPYATLLDIYFRTLFFLCGLAIIFCIIISEVVYLTKSAKDEQLEGGLGEVPVEVEETTTTSNSGLWALLQYEEVSNLGLWLNRILGVAWLGVFIVAHVMYYIKVKRRCKIMY